MNTPSERVLGQVDDSFTKDEMAVMRQFGFLDAQGRILGRERVAPQVPRHQVTSLDVLNEARERLARHYLESTDLNATEISFLLGFADPNSLFRAFHRWTGTTPEAWRANVRSAD